MTHEIYINFKFSWILVAFAYNPNYLGGRDQENSG
jgi:cbb3-type cytochrome oxidase subunit 3